MKVFMLSVCLLCPGFIFGQYTQTKLPGGLFERKVFGKIKVNEGSTLQADIFVLNHPAPKITIKDVSLDFHFKDSKENMSANMTLDVQTDIEAFEYRVTLFDVYGEHLKNLYGSEIATRSAGELYLAPQWASYDDVFNALTFVVYISKVRFKDGTLWKVNWEELLPQWKQLKLEKIAEDEQASD